MLSISQHYGIDPMVWPRSAGSSPPWEYPRKLGHPAASGGLGHGGRAHSDDEHIVIEGNETGRRHREVRSSRSWTFSSPMPLIPSPRVARRARMGVHGMARGFAGVSRACPTRTCVEQLVPDRVPQLAPEAEPARIDRGNLRTTAGTSGWARARPAGLRAGGFRVSFSFAPGPCASSALCRSWRRR